MSQFRKIIDVFSHFCRQFPLYFIAIFAVLIIEAIVAIISVATVIPLADLILDSELKNPNRYTIWIIGLLEHLNITPGLFSFALLFIISNFLKAFIDIFLKYFTLYLKYSVFKHMMLNTLSSFMKANWSFFTRNDQGKLLNTLQKELTNVGDTMGHMATQMSQFIQVLIYGLLPFFISASMTLWTFSLVIVFALPFLLLHRMGYSLGKANTNTANSMMSTLTETLSAMRIILSFSTHDIELKRNRDRINDHMQASIISQTFLSGIGYLFQPLAMTAVMIAMTISISNGTTVSEIAAIIWSLIRAMPVLSRMLQTNINISNFLPSYEQIEYLTNAAESAQETKGTKKVKILNGNISAKNLYFSYDGTTPTLKNVSFTLSKGKIIAFCGLSGSGKSTLVDLMLGLQHPSKGELTIDGINLNKLDKHQYRSCIGYVPQDGMLFNLSIRDNLLWANPLASNADIITALKQAHAYEFVSKLPNNIDTYVGERGGLLSGGQRQRITLARALIRKPDLLILDESTSALDLPAQELIKKNLHELSDKMAILLITHQRSFIDIADYVYILENGSLVAQGSPISLIETSPLFQQLFPAKKNK